MYQKTTIGSFQYINKRQIDFQSKKKLNYLGCTFKKYSFISAHLVKYNFSDASFATTSQPKKENFRFNIGNVIFPLWVIKWGSVQYLWSLVGCICRVQYFWGRVSNFNHSEARKQCYLPSDWLKLWTLPRKYCSL